jgi:hypothetical protein
MGRPSSYQPEYAEKALTLCKGGATVREVAEFFEVTERTIHNWSHEFPEFFRALKTGREAADARVEQSLYRRALGYSFDSVHISAWQGVAIQTPIVTHVPPDVTAAIFWLKNRKPQEWRDVKAVEHSGSIQHRHVAELSDAELAAIAAGSSPGASETQGGAQEPSAVH